VTEYHVLSKSSKFGVEKEEDHNSEIYSIELRHVPASGVGEDPATLNWEPVFKTWRVMKARVLSTGSEVGVVTELTTNEDTTTF